VTDTPGYLAMNPNRLVPTIEDGEVRLWESNVIVRYLAHQYGAGSLCPANIATRFDAERWMDWQATAFWPVFRPLFIALIRTAANKRDASVVSKSEALALSAVRILDHRLEDRVFLAGDAFTMGDIPAATSVHRWYSLDIDHPELPNVRRWYDLMRARFAFQQIVMTPLS